MVLPRQLNDREYKTFYETTNGVVTKNISIPFGIPTHCTAVTPTDTEDLANPGSLYVGTGGTLIIAALNTTDTVSRTVEDGTYIPGVWRRVYETGTDADNIQVEW